MSYSQFDVVTLAVDLLDENLRRGMKGVVIDVYHQPDEAYEVEFSDDEGKTLALLALTPEQLE
ncbi:TPA: DUF4926 domain-containing protein [Morganella morganii]